jgi:hypothetical protein
MPTIVFRMKMEPDATSYPIPMNKTPAVYQAEVALQRVSWLPNHLRNNRELGDDDTFTATGDEAVYIRDLINNGQLTFVEIVSTTN